MPLPVPCLMLVTNRALCGGDEGLISAVEEAVHGGVTAVQLREKDQPPEQMLPLARRLREITIGSALLLVNGPLQVALAAEADGVHLPEAVPGVQRPRPGFLIGRSVHSAQAARRAEAEGVDYLVAGPVYETRSHPGARPAGLSLLNEISEALTVPALAIGGIAVERVGEVVHAGASGVAVISAVLAAPGRRGAAEALRTALEEAWQSVVAGEAR